jgi:hypothetical protein
MKINPKDYINSKTRLAALNQLWEFGRELKVYLKRVLYALDRDCDRRDFFIGTQVYQDESSIVVEDGYSGFESYDSDMPAASYSILKVQAPAGIKPSGTAGLTYTVNESLSQNVTLVDNPSGDHADAVYPDNTPLTVKYHSTSDYSDNGVAITTSAVLTSNALAPTLFDAPDITGDAYIDIASTRTPRNAIYIQPGTNTDVDQFAQVFNARPLTSPNPAWFEYYPDAAAAGTPMIISLPFKTGVDPQDWAAQVVVYEAINNSFTPVLNLLHAHTVQATGTAFAANGNITFTKTNVLNGQEGPIENPLIIRINDLELN